MQNADDVRLRGKKTGRREKIGKKAYKKATTRGGQKAAKK